MKKIICALMSLLLVGGTSFAQAGGAAKSAPATQNAAAAKASGTKVAKEPKKNVAGASGEQQAPNTNDSKSAKKLKKDGTPDMRHAENKKAATPAAGKTKKDGTPDMRYKANKEAAAAKK